MTTADDNPNEGPAHIYSLTTMQDGEVLIRVETQCKCPLGSDHGDTIGE